MAETDDEFLARLAGARGRFGRADSDRLAAMMADAAERRGDVEAAARLRLGFRQKKGAGR